MSSSKSHSSKSHSSKSQKTDKGKKEREAAEPEGSRKSLAKILKPYFKNDDPPPASGIHICYESETLIPSQTEYPLSQEFTSAIFGDLHDDEQRVISCTKYVGLQHSGAKFTQASVVYFRGLHFCAHFLKYFASTLSNKSPRFNIAYSVDNSSSRKRGMTGRADTNGPDVSFWLIAGFSSTQGDIFSIHKQEPSMNTTKGVLMKICENISDNEIYIGNGQQAIPLQQVVLTLSITSERDWLNSTATSQFWWALNGSIDRIYRLVIEFQRVDTPPITFDDSEFNVISLSLFMKSLIQKLKSDSDGNMIRAARAESDRKRSDRVSVLYTTSDVSSILALSPFSLSGMKGMALLMRHPIIIPYGIYSYKNSVLLAFLNCFVYLDTYITEMPQEDRQFSSEKMFTYFTHLLSKKGDTSIPIPRIFRESSKMFKLLYDPEDEEYVPIYSSTLILRSLPSLQLEASTGPLPPPSSLSLPKLGQEEASTEPPPPPSLPKLSKSGQEEASTEPPPPPPSLPKLSKLPPSRTERLVNKFIDMFKDFSRTFNNPTLKGSNDLLKNYKLAKFLKRIEPHTIHYPNETGKRAGNSFKLPFEKSSSENSDMIIMTKLTMEVLTAMSFLRKGHSNDNYASMIESHNVFLLDLVSLFTELDHDFVVSGDTFAKDKYKRAAEEIEFRLREIIVRLAEIEDKLKEINTNLQVKDQDDEYYQDLNQSKTRFQYLRREYKLNQIVADKFHTHFQGRNNSSELEAYHVATLLISLGCSFRDQYGFLHLLTFQTPIIYKPFYK